MQQFAQLGSLREDIKRSRSIRDAVRGASLGGKPFIITSGKNIARLLYAALTKVSALSTHLILSASLVNLNLRA